MVLLPVLEGGLSFDFFFPLRQPQMFDTQQLQGDSARR
jgi:hypothetical protein